ncbi:AAA family ATPase [Aliivibrio fischeri]|uniref:retron Ec78 anti-phage system effector ATPase PtuA n=1 Tax=Aliivibrio fischeri TaxID=668 RepID=UPI0012DAC401|nr:retron Ec78 anti-phage system effector ATPase PtuA [Aliivibrio fischeri]MUK93248.1 AAA family ATPase [Aliivibrio fischeri]
MTSKTKNIKELERKAKKHELLSIFQLYQNYANGLDGIDKDDDQAQNYFFQCVNYIESNSSKKPGSFKPTNKLNLTNIELFDFRRFKNLRISFQPDLTVIIGDNGQGKTTILDAISKTLSWINANILKEDGAGQRLSAHHDIRRNSQNSYTDVLSEFTYGSGLKRLPSRLSRASLGAADKRDSDIKQLRDLSNIFRIVNDKNVINLPLCAFYSVERSHPLPRQNKENIVIREERFDAYNFALVGSGRFDHFVDWFIALHKKSVNDKSSQLESLKQQVKDLETSVANGVVSLEPILQQTKKQLNEALSTLEAADVNKVLTDLQTKDIVVNAICKVIPSISDIWVDTSSGSDVVLVKNDSVDITIKQLSDGQRIFLGLVSDLARRLVMLNPKLGNPLEGQGIVLIDEIELHLHPKWQQNIIRDLTETFPNIQFIVTTHSPQVLSTVDKSSIRFFVTDENGNVHSPQPQFQTKGVKSADILAELMGTNSIPDVEEARNVDRFSMCLLNNKKDDAIVLMDDLKKHFGVEHPVIRDCQNKLDIFEMKERIKLKREASNE